MSAKTPPTTPFAVLFTIVLASSCLAVGFAAGASIAEEAERRKHAGIIDRKDAQIAMVTGRLAVERQLFSSTEKKLRAEIDALKRGAR